MTVDLNLPPFGLDCREWLVVTEAEGLVEEQTDGAPIVAVLSTAVVVGNDLVSARAVLSLALLDSGDLHDDHPLEDDSDNLDSDHLDSDHLDSDNLDSDNLDSDNVNPERVDPDNLGLSNLDLDDVTPGNVHLANEANDNVSFDGICHDSPGSQDICVLEAQWSDGYARFAVPAPGGELAVVAEFSSAPNPSPELIDRFYDLVTSFRWAA